MDLVAIILFFWARWLSKQPDAPVWLRYVGPALVVAFFGSMLGTIGGLWLAFHAVENVDPANRATFLAQGISVAMNFTAVALIFDALVLVVLVFFTVRRPRSTA